MDWIKFDLELARDGGVDPVVKALYAAIASFADPQERDTEGRSADDIPTRKRLAECIGRSVKTVDRATAKLEEMGLLEVERRRDPDNPKLNVPSTYFLLDYERWEDRAAERAAERAAARKADRDARNRKTPAAGYQGDDTWRHIQKKRQGGGDTGDATPGDTGDARGRDTRDATQKGDELGQTEGGWGRPCRQGGDTGVAHSLRASYRDLHQEGGAGGDGPSSTSDPEAPAALEGEGAASQKDNPASGRKPSVPKQSKGSDGSAATLPPEPLAQATEDGTQPHSASGAAVELLASLDGDLALNSHQVAELAPLLTQMAHECGWDFDRNLRHELTRPRQGGPVKYPAGVLRKRIRDLKPNRTKRPQAPPRPGGPEDTEMCPTHPRNPKAQCLCQIAGMDDEEQDAPVPSKEESLAQIRQMSRAIRAGKL